MSKPRVSPWRMVLEATTSCPAAWRASALLATPCAGRPPLGGGSVSAAPRSLPAGCRAPRAVRLAGRALAFTRDFTFRVPRDREFVAVLRRRRHGVFVLAVGR